jgi:hypothetical protein
MNDIPVTAWALAGFVLAHSAWIVSDLPDKDLLAPFAILERSGKRELHPYEAPTQEEAIAAGKKAMPEWSTTSEAWAFAREASFREGEDRTDVLVIDFWARGMKEPATLIQKFERFTKHGRFKLLGDVKVSVHGKIIPTFTDSAKAQLRRGIQQHSKAAPLWDTWH